MKPFELFVYALSHPNENGLLKEISNHAPAILEFLSEQDIELSDEQNEILDQHPEWVAKLYDALSTDDQPVDDEEKAAIRELAEARLADETSIGKAFKNGLIKNLSDPD